MPNFRLWYFAGACSLAPHITLREAGVAFEPIQIKVQPGVGLPAEFKSINPKMQVPVLGVDDNIITENPAILTTIAKLSEKPDLLGKDVISTARVYEWLSWLGGTLHGQAFGGLWRPYRFSDDADALDSIKKKAMLRVEAGFNDIEAKVDGHHAVGDDFTVVDAYLFVFWLWGNRIGLEMGKKYPKYSALALSVAERDSTRAALATEGLDLSEIKQ